MSDAPHTDALTWALCAAASGGGPGKCDPEHCVCAAEARAVMAELKAAGYILVKIVHKEREPFVIEDDCGDGETPRDKALEG